MGRHAYLIMAHNEPKALGLLMQLLDDERNSLYIHIDERCTSIDRSGLKEQCRHAKVTVIQSEKVYWSGYSQIRISLKLLKTALAENHSYYHLISGVDLPLRSQDEIHGFFNTNAGSEFVSYGVVNTWKIASRYKYYHFEKLVDVLGRNYYRMFRLVSDTLQRLLFIDRTKKLDIEFHMGGNWFSITHGFAKYVAEQENFIHKTFKYGYITDEIFLPTLLMNSPFSKNVSPMMNLRYVDWTRGNPYVWQKNDFEELMSSNMIFARKFSYSLHPEIMEQIKGHLMSNIPEVQNA